MKKIYAVFLMVVILLNGGCSTQQQPFTVYVPGDNRQIKEAVAEFQKENSDLVMNIEEFEDLSELETRLSTELMSGKGPDVILMTEDMSIDVWKMVENQQFYDISGMLSDSEKYISAVLESGQYQEKQYLLPLSFSVMQLYTSEERLNQVTEGENLAFGAHVSEIMEVLYNDLQNATAEQGTIVNQLGEEDILYRWMQSAGYDMLNEDFDETLFKQIADTWQQVEAHREEVSSIATQYANNFLGVIEHVTFMLEDLQLTNNIRYYATMYNDQAGKNMQVIVPKTDEGYHVRVTAWGGIKSSSDYVDEGIELLQSIMDYPISSDFFKYGEEAYDLSINQENLAANVQEVIEKTGRAKPTSKELREPYATQIQDFITQIVGAYIPNTAVGDIVQETLQPYIEGTSDFESCYEEMVGRLERYVSE